MRFFDTDEILWYNCSVSIVSFYQTMKQLYLICFRPGNTSMYVESIWLTRFIALNRTAGVIPAKLVVDALFHFRRVLFALPHLPLTPVRSFAAIRCTAEGALRRCSVNIQSTICRRRRTSIDIRSGGGPELVLSVPALFGFVACDSVHIRRGIGADWSIRILNCDVKRINISDRLLTQVNDDLLRSIFQCPSLPYISAPVGFWAFAIRAIGERTVLVIWK